MEVTMLLLLLMVVLVVLMAVLLTQVQVALVKQVALTGQSLDRRKKEEDPLNHCGTMRAMEQAFPQR